MMLANGIGADAGGRAACSLAGCGYPNHAVLNSSSGGGRSTASKVCEADRPTAARGPMSAPRNHYLASVQILPSAGRRERRRRICGQRRHVIVSGVAPRPRLDLKVLPCRDLVSALSKCWRRANGHSGKCQRGSDCVFSERLHVTSPFCDWAPTFGRPARAAIRCALLPGDVNAAPVRLWSG